MKTIFQEDKVISALFKEYLVNERWKQSNSSTGYKNEIIADQRKKGAAIRNSGLAISKSFCY